MIELLLAYALSSTVFIDERGYRWWTERTHPRLPARYVTVSSAEMDRRCPGKLMCERPDVGSGWCWVYFAGPVSMPVYSDSPPREFDPYSLWHSQKHCDGYDHR